MLLRIDLAAATLDLVAAAPADEWHFVGAAKGQASVLKWMAHLVRRFLWHCTPLGESNPRASRSAAPLVLTCLGPRVEAAYKQIDFDEAWLCPSPQCHVVGKHEASGGATAALPAYAGSEFALEPAQGRAARADEHDCESEGCWHQLGTGHKLEPMQLRAEAGQPQVCAACAQTAYFPLRAGAQFGWGNQAEAHLMLRGIGLVGGSRPGVEFRP